VPSPLELRADGCARLGGLGRNRGVCDSFWRLAIGRKDERDVRRNARHGDVEQHWLIAARGETTQPCHVAQVGICAVFVDSSPAALMLLGQRRQPRLGRGHQRFDTVALPSRPGGQDVLVGDAALGGRQSRRRIVARQVVVVASADAGPIGCPRYGRTRGSPRRTERL
jgi:hypothetical protein